jgi:6-methylsalicylate decarboxylase
MRIDVHAHYYTEQFSERMRGLGGTRNDVPGGAITLDQRLDMMDGIGVDTQVLCVGAQQPYYPDGAKAVEAAHFANDFYKEIVEAHDGRFAAFGCVPLPHVDGAIAEAHRCLDELDFPGINLGCAVAGGPLDNPDFEPFWAELNRMKTVVFLHPLGTGGPLMDAYGLAWTVGGCFEDTIAGLRIAMSGLMQRYPDVEIIVPHLGGTIPFVWQRVIDHAERADKPWAMDALRRMYYDTVNSTRLALHCTCEAVGAGHVLLGTDFPYLLGPKLERCVTYIEQAGLPHEDVTAILDHNAQALLKLPER